MIRQALIHSDELNPSFKQVIEALTNKKEGTANHPTTKGD